MIRPKLLICAEGIITDRQTNNVSVFNILENLIVPNFPLIIPKLCIMHLLERDPKDSEEINVNMKITLSGREILNQPIKHNFQGLPRSRNTLVIGGLPIEQPGTLEISILKDSKSIISYTIEIQGQVKPDVKIMTTKQSGLKTSNSHKIIKKSKKSK